MIDQKSCPRRYTITTTEAAKLYGVSQRTVQRWAKRDGAPHKRNHPLGRIVFFEAELEDWLARRGWLNNKKEQKR